MMAIRIEEEQIRLFHFIYNNLYSKLSNHFTELINNDELLKIKLKILNKMII